MPLYSYKMLGPGGQLVSGRLEAKDADSLQNLLRSQGGLPIETRELPSGGTRAMPFRRRGKPSTKDLALATRELAMLIAAGQTVEQALQLMQQGAAPKSLRQPFTVTLASLRSGASLTEALGVANAFPPVYLAMVQAGEASGMLQEQLDELAAMLDRAARLRDQLISALIYPALLVCVAVAAVVLLLGLVVPQFAPLFEGAPHIPTMTIIVLTASTLLREWGVTLLIAFCVAVVALAASSRRPGFAGWCDDTALRLPVIGGLLILAASGRWIRVLSVLLKGGVPLTAALDLAAPVAGHRRIRAMLIAMRDGIKDGKGLTASLPPHPPMPEIALPLIKASEHSGRLEYSLGYLAELFDSRLEQSLKRLLAIFEPVCVLIMSAIVGSIVISILLAVVSINDLAF